MYTIKNILGAAQNQEKTPPKSIVSSWLGSLTNTVKYGNQVIDAVHKRTNNVINVLPNKVLYLGQTTD